MVLRGISLVDATDGLRLIDAAVLPIREARRGGVATAREWPPAVFEEFGYELHELSGFVLPPTRGDPRAAVWVVLGLEVPAEGDYRFAAIDVAYSVGWVERTQQVAGRLHVCSPYDAEATCHAE